VIISLLSQPLLRLAAAQAAGEARDSAEGGQGERASTARETRTGSTRSEGARSGESDWDMLDVAAQPVPVLDGGATGGATPPRPPLARMGRRGSTVASRMQRAPASTDWQTSVSKKGPANMHVDRYAGKYEENRQRESESRPEPGASINSPPKPLVPRVDQLRKASRSRPSAWALSGSVRIADRNLVRDMPGPGSYDSGDAQQFVTPALSSSLRRSSSAPSICRPLGPERRSVMRSSSPRYSMPDSVRSHLSSVRR